MLKKLEEKIKETKLQLPAHTIKPPVMITLLDLEDERDDILAKIISISYWMSRRLFFSISS